MLLWMLTLALLLAQVTQPWWSRMRAARRRLRGP